MAETLLHFSDAIQRNGTIYEARACGSEQPDGSWHGWIEFVPRDGGPALRSPRETTQPNRADAVYWATGLTPIYLDGALRRSLDQESRPPVTSAAATPSIFDTPAPGPTSVPPHESVLDPFSVYEKGETLLRRQLAAMSAWHLVNIVLEYELSEQPVETLNRLTAPGLIELIVEAVRREREAAAARKRR